MMSPFKSFQEYIQERDSFRQHISSKQTMTLNCPVAIANITTTAAYLGSVKCRKTYMEQKQNHFQAFSLGSIWLESFPNINVTPPEALA